MKKSKNAFWLKWCALAACIACVCGTLVGYSAYQKYNMEVSYVCLDVNPSFELCLNHQDKVINAIAYNEDGETLLNRIDYKNKHYKDVINDILHHEEFKKYLTQDLTITIVSNDDVKIQQNIEEYMEAVECDGSVVCSDSQTREKAYSNHCSVGKYVAYEELLKYDQDVTLEDCKNMTMREIHDQIDKHHSTHHSNENGAGDESQGDTHSSHHSNHH